MNVRGADLDVVRIGIRKNIVENMIGMIVEIDIDTLKEYCYIKEELKYAS